MAYDQQLADTLRRQENLEVALVTLITVCKRWPDAPLVVQRAIEVGRHVLTNDAPPTSSAAAPASSTRYMTALGKLQELEGWAHAKAERAAAPPSGFVGGHGYPDPEIYTWVDKLNALHRVCTLQSCAGHKCKVDGGPGEMCDYCYDSAMRASDASERPEHVWSGQLWLWLDEKMARYVYENAHVIAQLPCIEKFSVLWHVEGREILDIVFKGAGTGDLDSSMKAIVLFFEEASWRCNL